MQRIIISFFSLFLLISCQKQNASFAPADNQISIQQKFFLDPFPEWTNKYNEPAEYRVFYDIEKIMKGFGFSRLQAVQFQSCIKFDVVLGKKKTPQLSDFNQCLEQAKVITKKTLDTEKVAKSKFTVVFDLDETLYDQYQADEKCHSHKYTLANGKTKYFYAAPFANQIIKNISDAGGAVVLFSANLDASTRENLKNWPFDASNYLEHSALSGFLFNSHLTVYPKESKGGPIIEASKDLRVFDESLSKTLIVDDNPLRIFQPKNQRLIKKFLAKQYCSGGEMQKAFEGQLKAVWLEIRESLTYLEKEKVSFAQAYLPYTMMGQVTLSWLLKTNKGWNEERAVEFIRKNPASVDAHF